LKKHIPSVRVVLSDPEGSGLYNKVKYNVMFDPKESEGKKRRFVASLADFKGENLTPECRHQVDTVVEGIGINRVSVTG
jgi:cysteine synthase A